MCCTPETKPAALRRPMPVPRGLERSLTHRRKLTTPEHLLRPYTSHGPAPPATERPFVRTRSVSVAATATRCWTPSSEFDADLEAPRRRGGSRVGGGPRQRAASPAWTPPHLRPPPPPSCQPPAPCNEWSELDMRSIEEDAALYTAPVTAATRDRAEVSIPPATSLRPRAASRARRECMRTDVARELAMEARALRALATAYSKCTGLCPRMLHGPRPPYLRSPAPVIPQHISPRCAL